MLYALLLPLAGHVHAFNLFRYITFRAGGACLTALVISFIVLLLVLSDHIGCSL